MKRHLIDLDYLVQQYATGRTASDLGREIGVWCSTVTGWLREAGVTIRKIRPVGRKPIVHLQPRELVKRYDRGDSAKAMAAHFGTSRTVIGRHLRELDLPIRGRSEAETIRWSQATPRERFRQTVAAHQAVRGSRRPFAVKCRHAAARQARGWANANISPLERQLADWLKVRGLETIPQQAIGPYNCDLGAAPVAVEVWGGNWHFVGKHARTTPKRLRYLLDRGWSVLILCVDKRRFPLTESIADEVVAYVQAARRNPTASREYRVIRRAGETLAAGGPDDTDRAVIRPGRHRGHAISLDQHVAG